MLTCSIRILGGLPITVEFTTAPAEPDVGIFSPYLDDWWITHIANRRLKKPTHADWIYNRLAASKPATDRLIQDLLSSED